MQFNEVRVARKNSLLFVCMARTTEYLDLDETYTFCKKFCLCQKINHGGNANQFIFERFLYTGSLINKYLSRKTI